MDGHIPNIPNVVYPRPYFYSYPYPFQPYSPDSNRVTSAITGQQGGPVLSSGNTEPVNTRILDPMNEVYGLWNPDHPSRLPVRNPVNLEGRLAHIEKIAEFNSRYGRRLERTRDYIKDMCSLFAVVTIFLASLSVAFLSYFHDTLSDRPVGTPDKPEDTVITLLLLLATITSLVSTIFLIMGAIYAIFGPVKPGPKKKIAPIFTMFMVVKIAIYPITRFLRDGVGKDELSIEHAPSGTVVHLDILDYAAGRGIRFMSIALLFAVMSVSTFLAGLGVFVWTDQPLVVSILMTIFTFLVPAFFFFSVF